MADGTNDELVLILETRLKGASAIQQGFAAANNFANAENRVQREMRSGLGPYEKRVELQKQLNDALAKGASASKLADLRYSVFQNQRQIAAFESAGKPKIPKPKAERDVAGPYQRRIALQKQLNALIEKGADAAKLADLRLAIARNERQIKRVERPDTSPGDKLRDAFFSSRFSLPGVKGTAFQPLVGRSLDALSPDLKRNMGSFIKGFGDSYNKSSDPDNPDGGGKRVDFGAIFKGIKSVAGGGEEAAAGAEGLGAALGEAASGAIAIVGPLAAIGAVTVVAVQAMYGWADESTKLTQRFADMQSQLGGPGSDTARAIGLSRVTGVDAASAARSLRERITSDPMAMSIAAQNGVMSLPGIYGKRNFGDQYQKLIERLADNPNQDSAMRQADALGISQEVERYRLLSPETRRRMDATAQVTARVNNEDAQRRAAEFQAAAENDAQAVDNFKTAWGSLFSDGFIDLMNDWADTLNGWAEDLNTFHGNTSADFKKVPPAPGFKGALNGGGGTSSGTGNDFWAKGANGSSGYSDPASSASAANLALEQLRATQQLTGALKDMHRTIIGGKGREDGAIPAGLHGAALNNYVALYNRGLVRLGPLM